ncbi:MAG: oligosaccharide flippase family protein [Cypionkella sp.]
MIRRSFALAFADKFAGVAMNLATMAIVSRILTPAEVGLFLLASTVVILIETFRDFGIGAFLIKETELTPTIVRTAVTIMALMSLGLGLGALALSDVLARYYGNADLGGLLRVAALAFLVAPISNPLLALMRRDMAFGKVTGISVTAGLANATTTIALAVAGYGPFCFVWGSVVAAGIMAAGALICRPDWWIFRPALRHWRQILPFGTWSTIVALLGMLIDAFPRLILGRVLGFGEVGLFSRAVSLNQLPDRLLLSAVQPVLLPALSAHARNSGALKAPFLTGLSYVSGLQWPALAMIAVLADPIVRLLLGDQWLAVIPLVRIVALAYFFLFPMYLCYPVLVSLGRVKDMALAMSLALPPCFAIMLWASTYGLHAMALSLFLTGPIQVCVLLWFVRRKVPFALTELAAVLLKSGAVTAATVALPIALITTFGSWDQMSVEIVALAVIGAVAGWAAGVILLPHPLRRELGVIGTFVFRPA